MSVFNLHVFLTEDIRVYHSRTSRVQITLHKSAIKIPDVDKVNLLSRITIRDIV